MSLDESTTGEELEAYTAELAESVRTPGPPDDDAALTLYGVLSQTASVLATGLTEAVVEPVAKVHFEEDRGHAVTQVLPDHTDNYQFESHGFEALVLPDERSVTNVGYDSSALTETRLIREPTSIRARSRPRTSMSEHSKRHCPEPTRRSSGAIRWRLRLRPCEPSSFASWVTCSR